MGKRWLGPSHAHKVKANPLHYSSDIENCQSCVICSDVLHYTAFVVGGVETRVCPPCRERLAKKHRV